MFTTLIVFLLILGLLVFVHEFGHFWVAKKSGVRVYEFAFGFKPRLFAWKRGDTEYAINALPFGGYVRMEGEDKDTGAGDSFLHQPPLKRSAILVAGVVMNLLLAWVLLTATYIIGSYPLTQSFAEHPGLHSQSIIMVTRVDRGSPAEQAGLQAGDTIVSVDGTTITGQQQVADLLKSKAGQNVPITYVHAGHEATAQATPRANPPAGQGAFGIATYESAEVKAPWYKAPWYAALEIGSEMKATIVGFFQFIVGLVFTHKVSEDVSGVIGIGQATGVVRRLGAGPIMQFIALISTSLAVINILPIPPLDGGHLLFTVIEAIRRKPLNERYRQWVSMAGLVAILLLFVIVTYKDITRFEILSRLRSLF